VVVAGDAAAPAALQLAEALRDAWPGLRLEFNLGGGNFKSQFKRADRSGAPYALVLGDDEAARGVVAIKDLRQGRAQEECEISRIGERFGVLLGLKTGHAE
jgi:histidyl-tRNA synthetase